MIESLRVARLGGKTTARKDYFLKEKLTGEYANKNQNETDRPVRSYIDKKEGEGNQLKGRLTWTF